MNKPDPQPITEARLRRGLRTVALAIECYGDTYWPIFEALKAELDTLQSKRSLLAEFTASKSGAIQGVQSGSSRSKRSPIQQLQA